MAKYYNNQIKTGKVAGSVFSVRGGEVIERAYNPIVSNPNTDAQVAARAKFKELSQLAAVMGPYIPMKKRGNVSARNLFVKKNYGAVSYSNLTATINMTAVQLTDSVVGLPGVDASRGEGGVLNFQLHSQAAENDQVVYLFVVRQADGSLRVAETAVSTEKGYFRSTITPTSGAEGVVYAYGVRENTEAARVAFGGVEVLSAEFIATLVATRGLTGVDVTLTETRATILASA